MGLAGIVWRRAHVLCTATDVVVYCWNGHCGGAQATLSKSEILAVTGSLELSE
jgi:hypothetical protein